MSAPTFVILIICFASIAFADDFKTIDGKEYKNAKVSRVEPDGIVITFSGGIVKLPFIELPGDVQKKYGYNSTAAAAYSAEEYQKQSALAQQRKADEQQRLEERQKYWSEHPTPQPQQQSSSTDALHGSALDRPANGQSVGSISPQYLAAEYSRSEIRADELYKGRVFTVSGSIKSISKSGSEAGVELYIPYFGGTGTVKWFVCFFTNPGEVAWQRVGNPITVTGTVAGMNGNTLEMHECHL